MYKISPKLMLLTVFILLLASVFPAVASTVTTSDSVILPNKLVSNQQSLSFSSNPIVFPEAKSKVTTIDFENLNEWTAITDQYKKLGVIFSGDTQILTDGGHLNVAGYPPRSGKNVAFSYTLGKIQANFINPVSNVGFYYWSINNLYLDAYDKSGKLIETKTGAGDTTGYAHGPIMSNLNISNKLGITSIVIRSNANHFDIDDFSFTPAATNLVVTPSNLKYLQNLPQNAWINYNGLYYLNHSHLSGIDVPDKFIKNIPITGKPDGVETSDFQGLQWGECVSFVKALSHSNLNTAVWYQGSQVIATNNLAPGTVIATFKNGKYDSGHAAVFEKLVNGKIQVWDQNTIKINGKGIVGKRLIHGTAKDKNDPSSYYVVQVYQ